MMTAALPANAASGVSPSAFREAQSIAFLSAADSDELYSGEAIKKPSADFMSALSFVAFSGVPCFSKSSSNNGNAYSSRLITVTFAPAASAAFAAQRTNFLLNDPARRLPENARICGCVMAVM